MSYKIEKVAAENPGLGESELRKKFSEAYPFGQRDMWPYKVWLKCVNGYFNPRKPKAAKPIEDGGPRLFEEVPE